MAVDLKPSDAHGGDHCLQLLLQCQGQTDVARFSICSPLHCMPVSRSLSTVLFGKTVSIGHSHFVLILSILLLVNRVIFYPQRLSSSTHIIFPISQTSSAFIIASIALFARHRNFAQVSRCHVVAECGRDHKVAAGRMSVNLSAGHSVKRAYVYHVLFPPSVFLHSSASFSTCPWRRYWTLSRI